MQRHDSHSTGSRGNLNQTPLDWYGNQQRILQAIHEARQAGVQILCLPEICVTGYGCEDAFHSLGVQQTALAVLRESCRPPRDAGLDRPARAVQARLVQLRLPGRRRPHRRICGQAVLAGEGLHYEPRWFKPWPRGIRGTIDIDGEDYPIGDLIFDCGGIKIGFEICEDAWVSARPAAKCRYKGWT